MSARFVKSIFCDCGSDHASGGYRQGPAEVAVTGVVINALAAAFPDTIAEIPWALSKNQI